MRGGARGAWQVWWGMWSDGGGRASVSHPTVGCTSYPPKKSALYSSMDSSELRDELQKLKDSGGWAAAELRLPRPAGRRGQNGPKVEAGARKTKRPVNPKGGTVQVHRLHISPGTWFTVSTHFGSNSQTDSAANRTPGPISDPRPQERCPAQVCNPGLVRAGNGSLKFSY